MAPLPFAAPERLVAVWPDEFVSNDGHRAIWRERAHALEQVASLAPGWLMALVADGGEPQQGDRRARSRTTCSRCWVQPPLGRTFAAGDGTPGRDRVVVLSDGLWRRRFAADPAVSGRVVQVDQAPYEVIGVMPAGFELFGGRRRPVGAAPVRAGHATSTHHVLHGNRAAARRGHGRVRIATS